MHHLAILLLFANTLAASDCEIKPLPGDKWPALPQATNAIAVAEVLALYQNEALDWRVFARAGGYKPLGDYVNWSEAMSNGAKSARGTTDPNGVTMITYDNRATFVYNPVSIAQQALWYHSESMKGVVLNPWFWPNVDKLAEMQRSDGAFPYAFDHVAHGKLYTNWVSGMAQGMATSAMLRAYEMSSDSKYFQSASNSIRFMLQNHPNGGLGDLGDLDPSLKRYPMIREYPYEPDSYVLDGSLFAMLSLLDWSLHDPTAICLFNRLAHSIKRILPYYDVGGAPAVDLAHLVYGEQPSLPSGYMRINIALIWHLSQHVDDEQIRQTWRKWASYVGQPLDPALISITPSPGGSLVLSGWGTNHVKLETTRDLSESWEEIPIEFKQSSIAIQNLPETIFFKVTPATPLIDAITRNGSFDFWNSPTNLSSWSAFDNIVGNIIPRQGFHLSFAVGNEGGFQGIRSFILTPGKQYRVNFSAKSSSPGNMHLYLGTSGNPVASVLMGPNWTSYSFTGTAANTSRALALLSNATNAIISIDDLEAWELNW
jgi:hypothetical protein